MSDRVFHLLPRPTWDEVERTGSYRPASLADEGFIHLSTREQVPGTAARYFHGQGHDDLIVMELDVAALGAALRFEEAAPPGRNKTAPLGAGPFPHLYGAVVRAMIIGATSLRAWVQAERLG